MSEDATLTSNVQHRTVQLQNAFQEYEKLDRERKAIAGLQSDILKRLKDDVEIEPKAFKNAFKFWQMEAEARDKMLDQMHECFDALGIGEQMDWIEAATRVKRGKTDAFAAAPDAAELLPPDAG